MLPSVFLYLLYTLLFAFFWIILFAVRQDLRKSMFKMGLLLIIAGIIGQSLLWRNDWWEPFTITGTIIGIEDIIHGFTVGGIATGIYPFVFARSFSDPNKNTNGKAATYLSILSLTIALSLFWFFDFHSFYASSIGTILMWIILIKKRKELLSTSLLSGLLMMLLAIFVFLIFGFIAPEFVASMWKLENLSGIMLLYAPIEDVLFYYYAGAVTLPFYLYWTNSKLEK